MNSEPEVGDLVLFADVSMHGTGVICSVLPGTALVWTSAGPREVPFYHLMDATTLRPLAEGLGPSHWMFMLSYLVMKGFISDGRLASLRD